MQAIPSALEPYISTYGGNGPRVRQDIITFRQRFPNLIPAGDVTVIPNTGQQQRIVRFTGTIPIVYKGQTYHIPLSVVLPASYPFAGPMLAVTPTPDMGIKPRHPHVDQEGRCYLPALSQWQAHTSVLAGVVGELQGVFALNPPVYAKPKEEIMMQQQQQQQNNHQMLGGSGGIYPNVNINNNNYNNNVNNNNGVVRNINNNNNNGGGEQLRRQCHDLMCKECMQVSEELQQFLVMQKRLERGAQDIDQQVGRMQEHRRQLQQASEWTRKATDDVDAWMMSVQKKKELQQQEDGGGGGSGAGQVVDVDEIVIPTSSMAAQLLQAVAANKAIEDAIYFLNKSLHSDDVKIDCETYVKEMRKLCSAQFMHLALIRKIKSQMK